MSKIYLKSVKLEAFKNFLNRQGIEWREPPNSAIVLQIKQGKEWFGIYKRDNYPLTLTVDKRLINILEAFEKRNDLSAKPKHFGVAVEEAAKGFKKLGEALAEVYEIEASKNPEYAKFGGFKSTKKPFKIDWLHVAFFTLVLFVGLFVGYGIKTQCPNLADNIYIKCSK